MVTKRQNYVSPNLDVYDLVEEDIVTASDLGERVIDPWPIILRAGASFILLKLWNKTDFIILKTIL